MDRKKRIQEYFKDPADGLNEPMNYLQPVNWYRTLQLTEIINELYPATDNPKILEIGTNIGRNLMMLRFDGYTNLHGIELSEEAIRLMREVFPLSNEFQIHTGEVENLIYKLMSNHFDVVFTMAVLQHIPPESDHIFKQIVRVTKGFLITIEDEKSSGWRHIPRRYNKIFEPLGLEQIQTIKKIERLGKCFVGRIFKTKK